MLARSALALALLSAAAGGVAAMGALPPLPRPAPDGEASFACVLSAREGGGGVAIEGRVEARAPVSGTYALRVRGGGVAVDQSGDFAAKAGETVTLGQAQLSGGARSLDASLSLTAGGRTTTCPLQVL